MLCLLHDESIMNVTKNKKYKNLKRRDQQQAALVVISWDPLQSFISGFIRGLMMLMITLRFQTLQAPLGPVNCMGWSGLGYIEVP